MTGNFIGCPFWATINFFFIILLESGGGVGKHPTQFQATLLCSVTYTPRLPSDKDAGASPASTPQHWSSSLNHVVPWSSFLLEISGRIEGYRQLTLAEFLLGASHVTSGFFWTFHFFGDITLDSPGPPATVVQRGSCVCECGSGGH